MDQPNFNRESIPHAVYRKQLRALQVELVTLQRHYIKHGHRILIVFEGRDSSGKDGVIKRIVEHLSPRETRVVALGNPTERERASWYFQRFVPYLPANGEMVLFNRSWYNRAGVEWVMGFCTPAQHQTFLDTVNDFERILMRSGTDLIKYYLDISKEEQKRRLAERRKDPLKQWKTSPIDEQALNRWDDYSRARDLMLRQTSTADSPWIIVRTDEKGSRGSNVIRDILSRVQCPDSDEHLATPDRSVVFPFEERHLADGKLAR